MQKNNREEKEIKLKQGKNQFNSRTREENSVFYSADKITRNLLNKTRKSYYPNNRALITFCLLNKKRYRPLYIIQF